MNKETEFFVDCIPPKSTAQASHRIMKRKDGTQFVGKAGNSKGARTQAELLLLLGKFKTENMPFEGAVSLDVKWIYPWRKAEPKKNKTNGIKFCDKRPDCDNILKLLQDCMTRLGFWNDDSQIASLKMEKYWGDKPGIYIRIEEINGYTKVNDSNQRDNQLPLV